MISRKIADAEAFINPKYEDLISFDQIPNVIKAVERILKAVKQKEKVAVFTDYDADGVCGGAIMYKALKEYFSEVFVIVPDRSAGYGLNMKAVDQLVEKQISLLVTVDCGIKNIKEIASAKQRGIDTIVVDHHQLGDELPSAIMVHPHLSATLKFKHFSGGGVAFFLAKALSKKKGNEKWLLDLVAISTIADMVPLIEGNRILVKYGLLVLNKTKNIGLKKLMEKAGIKSAGGYEVGYMIAPRLNAAGRISLPRKSFDLLTNNDDKKIDQEAQVLNDLNEQRQDLLSKAQVQAIKFVEKEGLFKNKIIVLEVDFPEGIIGLISGKITQHFFRPSIVLSRRDGLLKGSARSIKGIDITKLLGKAKDLLESYGGHEQAAGISIKAKNLPKFKKLILSLATPIEERIFEKKLYIDALINREQINRKLALDVEMLEPFGQGNYRPIFALKRAVVSNIRHIGKNKDHISFEIDGLKAVGFCFKEKCWDIRKDCLYDIAFSINVDRWNSREDVKIIIEDVKESQ